jgi:hypothetical protein
MEGKSQQTIKALFSIIKCWMIELQKKKHRFKKQYKEKLYCDE